MSERKRAEGESALGSGVQASALDEDARCCERIATRGVSEVSRAGWLALAERARAQARQARGVFGACIWLDDPEALDLPLGAEVVITNRSGRALALSVPGSAATAEIPHGAALAFVVVGPEVTASKRRVWALGAPKEGA